MRAPAIPDVQVCHATRSWFFSLPSFLEDLPTDGRPGRWNRKSRSGVGNWSENRGLTLPVFRLRQTANQDLAALPGAKRGYALRVAR